MRVGVAGIGQDLSRTVEAVGTLDARDVQRVGVVPLLAAVLLGQCVVGVGFPGGDGGFVGEVGDGDAEAVGAAGGVGGEEAGLGLDQFEHGGGGVGVAVVDGAAQRGEDDGVV